MRTKKNPMAAVHSATGYSTSKTSFIDSETSGIIWRRHVAKKMPAAKQFKYAITSDLLFDFHQGIYQYIIILEYFHSRMNGNKFILWKYYFLGPKIELCLNGTSEMGPKGALHKLGPLE